MPAVRSRARAPGLLMILCTVPLGLAGQDTDATSCPYDRCALRIRPGGFFSGADVVRGADAVEVTGYGRSATLEELFAVDDSASHHYGVFARHDSRASRLGWLGIGLVGTGMIVSLHSGREVDGWGFGLQLGGFVSLFVSQFPRRRAWDAFSNAMWWYNRSLAAP